MIAHTKRKARKQEGDRGVAKEAELGDTIIRNVNVRAAGGVILDPKEREEEEEGSKELNNSNTGRKRLNSKG